ncbi:MAG: alpha-amylase family glycosyl hydrolase [Sphingobium sp.]
MIDPALPLGARVTGDGVSFAVWGPDADRLDLILFDGGHERSLPFPRGADGLHHLHVPGIGPGQAYALESGGQRLVDPYALALDRPYGGGEPPRALVTVPRPVPPHKPGFRAGGFIYELAVRPFTMVHLDVPEGDRGTLRALAHPAIIDHLTRIGVDAVELMPVIAWIDERHLPSLGLTNGWGYNPVTFMPVDPRLGTLDDLAAAARAFHVAGIDLILDMVFNHTGESDIFGRTLSFRGLGNQGLYRHAPDGSLVNDTGCGNTVACDHPMVRRMILDTLRHFVLHAGVDGFRFDLAPILGRTAEGFSAHAALLEEMRADPLIADRILIAEPWDIGPGGYQLGRFGEPFLEWNDRYRDDVRRFWRGDAGTVGALATRLAGSSDIFAGARSRTVNFLAAHDGFTLADLVAHETRHNEANGEQNRDGHGENFSWNNGAEGATDDPAILAARRRDIRALLATLFASRGTIMLTAGDEFGRSQRGNNNAYCQDNAITWVDWSARDEELEAFVADLARLRRAHLELADPAFLRDGDVAWLTEAGEPMTVADWEQPDRATLEMRIGRMRVLFNRSAAAVTFADGADVPPRSVRLLPIPQETRS